MDMFEAMRTAAFLQKVSTMNAQALPADQALHMATLGGAQALGMEREIGSLEVGKKADLIVVDLTATHMRPVNRIQNSLVYCASSHDVETVICDGRVLMENWEIVAFDEAAWVGNAVDYAFVRFRDDGIELPDYFRLA
jgi:5-methylthioadenosine/S-adenosylhomocysteine deaminase